MAQRAISNFPRPSVHQRCTLQWITLATDADQVPREDSYAM